MENVTKYSLRAVALLALMAVIFFIVMYFDDNYWQDRSKELDEVMVKRGIVKADSTKSANKQVMFPIKNLVVETGTEKYYKLLANEEYNLQKFQSIYDGYKERDNEYRQLYLRYNDARVREIWKSMSAETLEAEKNLNESKANWQYYKEKYEEYLKKEFKSKSVEELNKK